VIPPQTLARRGRIGRGGPNPRPARPYILSEITWKTARETKYEVAILPWSATEQVTDDTGVGNPREASAEKGARYVAALVERMAEFLVDLATTDPQDLYE
jgi:hypothetical protein